MSQSRTLRAKVAIRTTKELYARLESLSEEGFNIVEIENMGRGITSQNPIKKGDYVMEYKGELLTYKKGLERETMYVKNNLGDSYMFFFSCGSGKFCIDATPESPYKGRLINHARNGNLKPKAFEINGKPRLFFLATEDILINEELFYDYGDWSRETLKNFPWFKFRRPKRKFEVRKVYDSCLKSKFIPYGVFPGNNWVENSIGRIQ